MEPSETTSLKRKIVGGAAWMIGMRFAVNAVGIMSTIVLARLLTPSDFGVVALAGSAYAFLSLLGQFGFDNALIHLKRPSADHYNTAWTANIMIGVIVAASMFFVGRPAAIFFDDPRIEHVVYAFSMLSLAKGFENIGVVNFRKNLQFKGDFLYFVVPKVTSALVGVASAIVLRSYWALVIGMIASQAMTLLYSYYSQPMRPKISLKHFRQLFGYSRWILSMNLLQYSFHNGVEILLGKLKNAAAVGIYGIAREISFLPSSELLAPINRALFPGMSLISDDPDRQRAILTKVVGATALVSIPSALGLLAIADTLVLVALGAKWVEAAPVISILALAGVVDGLRHAFGPVLLSRGKPKVLAQANAVIVMVTLPLAIMLVPITGITGAAYASLIGYASTLPLLVAKTRAEIGFGWSNLVSCTWRPILASAVMALIVTTLQTRLASHELIGVSALLGLVASGIITFAGILSLIWAASGSPPGAEKTLFDYLRIRFRRVLKMISLDQKT